MKVSNDVSYFTVRLQELLTESYPDLASDKEFIEARSESALVVYSQAISNGSIHLEATHLANEVLFADLPFSKMDMIFDVVCNEFHQDIEDEELRSFSEKMYPLCQPTFNKYDMTLIEKQSSHYDELYAELTSNIQTFFNLN